MDQVFNEYVAALTKDAFYQAFQYGAGQPLVFPFCNWCKIGVVLCQDLVQIKMRNFPSS